MSFEHERDIRRRLEINQKFGAIRMQWHDSDIVDLLNDLRQIRAALSVATDASADVMCNVISELRFELHRGPYVPRCRDCGSMNIADGRWVDGVWYSEENRPDVR